jgi:hypothetical protein
MEDVHVLVASTNTQGRYALDGGTGPEISSGQVLAIYVAGQWIEGSVEYSHALYVNMGMQRLGEPPRQPAVLDGYCFLAVDGGIVGLCVGMKVMLA